MSLGLLTFNGAVKLTSWCNSAFGIGSCGPNFHLDGDTSIGDENFAANYLSTKYCSHA